jgi:uncharacterized alkaline shock family protein YloU
MDSPRVSGEIKISEQAIEELAAYTAMQSYGVIGMAVSSWRARLKRFLGTIGPDQGVKVEYVDGGVRIDLYIMVEHGTNIREIAKNLTDQIAYTVNKQTKLDVKDVEVHVSKIKT